MHLKRPCDRNSMPQEIECSCITAVCFSIKVTFSPPFRSCFFTPSPGNGGGKNYLFFPPFFCLYCQKTGLNQRFSAYSVMFSWISLDGIICPPPTLEVSVGLLQNAFVSRYWKNLEFHNHESPCLWEWV